MDNLYCVYILAQKKDGVLYIGVTNDIKRRVWEHRQEIVAGFTQKYHVKKLVYYETTPDITSAILRETQIKRWRRHWKIRLIQAFNPNWNDLYEKICGR